MLFILTSIHKLKMIKLMIFINSYTTTIISNILPDTLPRVTRCFSIVISPAKQFIFVSSANSRSDRSLCMICGIRYFICQRNLLKTQSESQVIFYFSKKHISTYHTEIISIIQQGMTTSLPREKPQYLQGEQMSFPEQKLNQSNEFDSQLGAHYKEPMCGNVSVW